MVIDRLLNLAAFFHIRPAEHRASLHVKFNRFDNFTAHFFAFIIVFLSLDIFHFQLSGLPSNYLQHASSAIFSRACHSHIYLTIISFMKLQKVGCEWQEEVNLFPTYIEVMTQSEWNSSHFRHRNRESRDESTNSWRSILSNMQKILQPLGSVCAHSWFFFAAFVVSWNLSARMSHSSNSTSTIVDIL